MGVFEDNFTGSVDPAWVIPPGGDPPVVVADQLTDGGSTPGVTLVYGGATTATPVVQRIAITTSATPSGATALFLADSLAPTASVAVALVTPTVLIVQDEGGAFGIAFPTLDPSTTYWLELVASTTSVVGNLYEADGTTLIVSTTDSTSGSTAALMTAGVYTAITVQGAGAAWDDYSADAAEFGEPAEPPPIIVHGAGMVFSITTLRYPESDPYPDGLEPVRIHRLTQFWDGEVEIPLDDMRSARVTISVYDPACLDVLPLERFLHVRYQGSVIFWGPITDPEWDLTNGRVTINALGPEYRLVKHFVRVGDVIGGETVTEEEEVPTGLNAADMYDFVLCGFNTAGQTTRGVPDLGIGFGTSSDNSSTSHITTQRGDQCFYKIVEIADSALGPDFEFVPQEIDQGNYALFTAHDRQGTDRTATVKFHYGWGLDNLDGWSSRPSGSSVVTHRHTVSADGHHRGTAAAEGPSARFGPYVEWDTIEGNPTGVDDGAKNAVLAEIGRGTVVAYGEPPEFLDLTLKVAVDSVLAPKYGVDYNVGDVVECVAHKGAYRKKLEARITKVTLTQTSSLLSTQPALELVPRILADDDVSSPED